MKKKRAYTLVEVLVSISILAILYGILVPVFVGVKAQAKETDAKSHLKQIFVASALYRIDYEVSSYGTCSSMGYPLLENLSALSVPISFFTTSPCVAPTNSPVFWAPDDTIQFEQDSLRYEENTILVADMNCNDKGTPLASEWYPIKGLGATVGGQVKIVKRAGAYSSQSWWQP